MKRATSTLRGRLALLALVSASLILGGWNAWTYNGTIVVWPNARSTRYLMPGSFPQGATHTQQFIAAMGEWSSIDKCGFDFYYQILPQDYTTDHYDGYSDTTVVSEDDLDPGILAVTYSVNDEATWFDMDMEFNDFPLGVGWNFLTNPTCVQEAIPGEFGFCFKLAALHECGHAIGLAHEPTGTEPVGAPWIVCTMNPAYVHGGSTGSARHFETHADDRFGARLLYPSTAGAGMTDLATLNFTWSEQYVGVSFTVFSSPNPVQTGAPLTIRSAIENRGSVGATGVVQQFWLSQDEVLDSSDLSLGETEWDMPGGGLIDFDFIADLPEDLPSGEWRAITVLDPSNAVAELYEDNNDAVYCVPTVVTQRVPDIVTPLGQHFATAHVAWQSPVPAVTHPINMAPMQWSLAGFPPQGATINPATGVISWNNPIPSEFQYMFFVRATNAAGSDTEILYLGVNPDVCIADINNDGVVNGVDLALILAYWGVEGAPSDLNGDGTVSGMDLTIVLGGWGPCH